MMTPEYIQTLRQLMEFEASRTEPPLGFPALPDIPAGRYVDPRFHQLEREHVWRKSWLLAAHIDEIPEPGCYMLWENAGQPVVIVHAESGAVNAFYNTCSHRGAPVVTDDRGKSRRLTCKYHGWSYDHEGELRGMRDPEDFRDFDMSCRSLRKVRCERFGNLVFVNFDPAAPTLLDWLGPIAGEWEEFQFGNCRLASRAIFDLDCNWKIAMEANTEVYHVRSIHPNTVAPILDDRRNVNTLYPHGHGRMIAPTPKGKSNLDAVGGPGGIPEIPTVGEIARTCTQSYGLFPNFVAPLSQFAIPPILFWPNGINKCRMETWTMAPQWPEGMKPDLWTVNDGKELCQVLIEDTQFGEKIQRSMESYGFEGVPLSYQEARIYHWNQAADKMIGADNIPEELRVQQVIGEEWIYPNDPRIAQL
ncbi:MAG: aromatic ring-hydroxylating dioxygenase subunit alpha [Proteobacteria bacterium]|jgi:phenylpropionate dioxygenase-like ring-hydroxylating dioxygenase large terminal subunit|nr:aromatic ring-hydroxylating dioxygenase subunit alpha [Pseudomonadota bacterium]